MTRALVATVALVAAATTLAAAPAPHAPLLVVTRMHRTHAGLYLLRPGRGTTLFARDAADATVSRDGRLIAFARGGAIWVMPSDDTHAHKLTHPAPPLKDDNPAWAPDGKTVYFSRGTEAASTATPSASLFAVSAAGGTARRVTRATPGGGFTGEPACHLAPSTSPSGHVIAYTVIDSCFHGEGYRVAGTTAAGKRAALRIALADPPEALHPAYAGAAWATRREALAYGVFDEDSGFTGLYAANVGSGHSVQVATWTGTNFRGDIVSAAWSRDDRQIAYVRGADCLGCPGDIWLASSSGGDVRRLTRSGDVTSVAWLR